MSLIEHELGNYFKELEGAVGFVYATEQEPYVQLHLFPDKVTVFWRSVLPPPVITEFFHQSLKPIEVWKGEYKSPRSVQVNLEYGSQDQDLSAHNWQWTVKPEYGIGEQVDRAHSKISELVPGIADGVSSGQLKVKLDWEGAPSETHCWSDTESSRNEFKETGITVTSDLTAHLDLRSLMRMSLNKLEWISNDAVEHLLKSIESRIQNHVDKVK